MTECAEYIPCISRSLHSSGSNRSVQAQGWQQNSGRGMPLQRVVEKLAQQQLMAHIDMTQHLGDVLLSNSPDCGLTEVYKTCSHHAIVTCLSHTLTLMS